MTESVYLFRVWIWIGLDPNPPKAAIFYLPSLAIGKMSKFEKFHFFNGPRPLSERRTWVTMFSLEN